MWICDLRGVRQNSGPELELLCVTGITLPWEEADGKAGALGSGLTSLCNLGQQGTSLNWREFSWLLALPPSQDGCES